MVTRGRHGGRRQKGRASINAIRIICTPIIILVLGDGGKSGAHVCSVHEGVSRDYRSILALRGWFVCCAGEVEEVEFVAENCV